MGDGQQWLQEKHQRELQSEIDNWKDKHNKTQDEVADLEVKFDQIETENARLRFQLHENEAQRDKLNQVRHEFDRAADRYNQDIDRMTEKLQNIHFQYEKAKTEKEKTELQSLKLSRDLERTTEELIELRDARGIAEKSDIETLFSLFQF